MIFDLFHAVGAEDHRGAVFREAEDFVLDDIGIHGVEAAEGFIEDDELGLMEDGGDEL
jgi:hypothetical protein